MTEIDLVLTGGNVWTGVVGGDGAIARTHAVAVSDGLVVAVGDEAAALAGDAREVIDAAGATVAPGFGDGHAHPVFGGIETLFAPVRGHSSVESLAAAVGAWTPMTTTTTTTTACTHSVRFRVRDVLLV